MMKILIKISIALITLQSCVLVGCIDNEKPKVIEEVKVDSPIDVTEHLFITQDVPLSKYFYFMDSILTEINEVSDDSINEYVLVHANPWIIDSLAATDYYLLKDKGIIVRDLLALDVLKKGMRIRIPGRAEIAKIESELQLVSIDLNIPEYKLRIYKGDSMFYEFLVRVGRNERKFLAMAEHVVDLKTKSGVGEIVRIVKNASFINPVDNKPYHVTRRDDNVVTSLPNIPWLEPEINGVRHGQLLHPTTNLQTLGKAYSNGCVGLRESDSWILYYYAPLGTKVEFRYDLQLPDGKLRDIYR